MYFTVTSRMFYVFPPAVLVVSLMLCAVSHAAFALKSAYNFTEKTVLKCQLGLKFNEKTKFVLYVKKNKSHLKIMFKINFISKSKISKNNHWKSFPTFNLALVRLLLGSTLDLFAYICIHCTYIYDCTCDVSNMHTPPIQIFLLQLSA